MGNCKDCAYWRHAYGMWGRCPRLLTWSSGEYKGALMVRLFLAEDTHEKADRRALPGIEPETRDDFGCLQFEQKP
jgi:hypothetical protein